MAGDYGYLHEDNMWIQKNFLEPENKYKSQT